MRAKVHHASNTVVTSTPKAPLHSYDGRDLSRRAPRADVGGSGASDCSLPCNATAGAGTGASPVHTMIANYQNCFTQHYVSHRLQHLCPPAHGRYCGPPASPSPPVISMRVVYAGSLCGLCFWVCISSTWSRMAPCLLFGSFNRFDIDSTTPNVTFMYL
jgi:hypothetical protein